MTDVKGMPEGLKLAAQYEWPEGAYFVAVYGGKEVHFVYDCDRPPVCDHEYSKEQHAAARQQLGLEPASAPGGATGARRTAEAFLHEAAELMAERGKQYDQKGGERSMGKTVNAFNAITGKDLTESEGWLLMSLLKRVRQHSGAGYHKDSAEDAVAYAALEAESLEAQK
jgi:hypothetical protein